MPDRTANWLVRVVDAEAVRPLRHTVLRPAQDFEQTRFPGDNDDDALHLGVVPRSLGDDGQVDAQHIVGIASYFVQVGPILDARMPTLTPGAHWRLRGMAVKPELQGRGLGRMLLRAGLDGVGQRGGTLLWCNARESARAFYEAQGFVVSGERFELEGIGPHYVMWRQVW